MKKTVLISLDALSETEFDRLKKLKNFSSFFKNGAFCKNSISVYPTQTYTVHTSVITGTYPDKHGIYNNQNFQPFVESKSKEWFWYRHQISTNTLYDAVRKQNGKVASILWPVSGKAKIKYNIPEIIAINNENQAIKVMKNSSLFFALRNELTYGKMRKGISQPQLDEFAVACAVDSIERRSPDLVMVHLVCIDSAKHNYGVESPMIDKALDQLDRMLGEIIDACKNEYNIILFSDHGQFTVEKEIYLNVFLKDNGLVDFKNRTYKVYLECMGGSAILRTSCNDCKNKTLKLLEENKELLGIEAIYDRSMLDKLKVDKGIEYIIEAKKGYHFKEGYNDNIVKDLKKNNIVHATHGYSPLKKGYGCVFFALGNDIKQGYAIKKMSVTDIAPTVAEIMGLEKFECDGKIIREIFK